MRQWRILHTEASCGWGGQEMRVLAELEWMRARGHWVALAADPQGEIARRAGALGVMVLPLRTAKAWLPVAVAELALWLTRHRVEIVNTHSSSDGWLAGLAARLSGRRVLIRSRHIEVEYPQRFWSRLSFCALPDFVITTSQRIADRLQGELGLSPQRVACIATGIDLTRFRPEQSSTLRAELALPPGVALAGMVSVLRSWKGHATYLAAAEKLIASLPGVWHFVIAGDGPARAELARAVDRAPLRGHVTLLGHRADVPNVLAGLDVLALPSFAHEGIPQILLQAQAMRCPVVATTIGGIPEVVRDGVTGLLIPPRDAEALAAALERLRNDSPLCAGLVENGRAQVVRHYDLDRMGERLLDLYQVLALRKI